MCKTLQLSYQTTAAHVQEWELCVLSFSMRSLAIDQIEAVRAFCGSAEICMQQASGPIMVVTLCAVLMCVPDDDI